MDPEIQPASSAAPSPEPRSEATAHLIERGVHRKELFKNGIGENEFAHLAGMRGDLSVASDAVTPHTECAHTTKGTKFSIAAFWGIIQTHGAATIF